MTITPWYPTNISGSLDMYGIANLAQTISGGILFPLILLTIFFITLIGMAFSGKSVFRGITYAGLICSVLSILLVLMNFLNRDYMYLCFLITGIGILGVRLTEAMS